MSEHYKVLICQGLNPDYSPAPAEIYVFAADAVGDDGPLFAIDAQELILESHLMAFLPALEPEPQGVLARVLGGSP